MRPSPYANGQPQSVHGEEQELLPPNAKPNDSN